MSPKVEKKCSLRFEPIKLDSIFHVLDGVSWLDKPDNSEISQFSGLDPRTVGKAIKNCLNMGIVTESSRGAYVLTIPYPFKGSESQKKTVLKEAIFKMPLIASVRQFLKLGDTIANATRKAATVQKITNYEKLAIEPLIKWADQLGALSLDTMYEDFAEEGVQIKEERHQSASNAPVIFLSHSSQDKPFIRQLAADLSKEGIIVWLDEQQIKVGDSINDKISQGLAESDYFVIALSQHSINSEWVKRELNSAMITEIESKKVHVLPVKISDCQIPVLLRDKKHADFTSSYKSGLNELIKTLKE